MFHFNWSKGRHFRFVSTLTRRTILGRIEVVDTSSNSLGTDLKVYGPAGQLLARGISDAENVDEHISSFVASSGGTYSARISGDAGEAYSLIVTRDARFELEPNDQPPTARDISDTGLVLGHVSGPTQATLSFYHADFNDEETVRLQMS